MADQTYDAVIIGGGTKALFLAMYLIKYGGMSVGIFERRHEIGGCLATEEAAAPGFRGNTHANVMVPVYHLALWRDFPEVWDYGLQFDQYLCSSGGVFANNNTCLSVYSEKFDPTQERSAQEIARFSEKDADTWLRLWNVMNGDEMQRVQIDGIYSHLDERALDPKIAERQIEVAGKLMEADLLPDDLMLQASGIRIMRELFDTHELQHCALRWYLTTGMDVNEPGHGAFGLMIAAQLPILSYARGGTHQVAHAAHQVLVQSGCNFFTHSEVDKVLIENGAATGIRLADGSEVKANKVVVAAGMNPNQLCFDLIGEEHMPAKLAKRVKLLEIDFGCLMWYTVALHEAPKYTAEEFNPDIHETNWLAVGETADPEHIARECKYLRIGMWPPLEDQCNIITCHSLPDPSYAPPGKHVIQNEQVCLPATAYTEKEWMKMKNQYADELLTVLQRHAPNMTWDNVIGIDTTTAYDCCRMKNLRPSGNMAGIDRPPYQLETGRPTPELQNHRTPVKNLYATGGCWYPGANSSSIESYSCYKIIATDLGLEGKPWEEPGKEEPESLLDQLRTITPKMREQFKRDPQYSKP